MYFIMAIMFVVIGITMAGIADFVPAFTVDQFGNLMPVIPDSLKMILFFVGMILSVMGVIMLWLRATKTGANLLIAPGRPDRILWFYVFKDGTIRIVNAARDVEGFTYSKTLDTEATEMKSYRLFDHHVRIIPEGIGSATDLGACLYCYFIRTKHGFKSIKDARETIFINDSEKSESNEGNQVPKEN